MVAVDPTMQAGLAAIVGAVMAGGAVLAWHISDRQRHTLPQVEEPVVQAGVAAVLSILRSSAVVVDESDHVLKASAPAYAFGLVRGSTRHFGLPSFQPAFPPFMVPAMETVECTPWTLRSIHSKSSSRWITA